MQQRFYAHSVKGQDESCWQTLPDHLNQVGALAAEFAKPFGASALAETAGKLHDLGKYSSEFQARLRGGSKVDHATWGAVVACERYGAIYGHVMAYGIAGHHAGLANGAEEKYNKRRPLDRRLNAPLPKLFNDYLTDLVLPEREHKFKLVGRKEHPDRVMFQRSVLTRMIFSCVVDGDCIDTDRFYANVENRVCEHDTPRPTLAELRDRLGAFVANRKPETSIDDIRTEILTHVRSQATERIGMFSLTVPTGGGKTLTSLAFALDHAIAHGLDRVIFVIPFTSIVEQKAAVFRKVFGDLGNTAVIEHHSAYIEPSGEDEDSLSKLRVAMENWDAPIVVTTSVQFFESLHSSKRAQCRKLHNIAGSVVVLDEAQTMPLKLLRPCVAMLDELALNYKTSVVLCTATQPALNAPDFKGGFKDVHELAPHPEALFERLARVTVVMAGTLDDAAITQRMQERSQALCIVNNRRHAQSLFASIRDKEGARHLSTLMYPSHRLRVLNEIRDMLRDEQPCRLISTSLIEAGVDIDFPYVLRAETGLDSIAQAAGRCNRSGKNTREESFVEVFSPGNESYRSPAQVVSFALKARETLRNVKDDPLSMAAIKKYFQLVYWEMGDDRLDKHNVLDIFKGRCESTFPFEQIDTNFRMIENVQMPIIIPRDQECIDLLSQLETADSCKEIARKLQRYLIQIPPVAYRELLMDGAIQPVAEKRYDHQFMRLMALDFYDDQIGLKLTGDQDIDPNNICW